MRPGEHHNGGGCSAFFMSGANSFFYLHSIFSGKEAVPMNKIKCTGADMITLGELIALLTLIVSIAMLVVMIVK